MLLQEVDYMGISNVFKMKFNDKKDSIDRYVFRMCDSIFNKCNNGKSMDNLNEYERTFYITQIFEIEVKQGGFTQFYCSSSGDFSGEIVQAFMKIGAFRTANLCKKALAAFGNEIPNSRNDRKIMIDQMARNEFSNILKECDDIFHSYEEDLNAINYVYLMKNNEHFQ